MARWAFTGPRLDRGGVARGGGQHAPRARVARDRPASPSRAPSGRASHGRGTPGTAWVGLAAPVRSRSCRAAVRRICRRTPDGPRPGRARPPRTASPTWTESAEDRLSVPPSIVRNMKTAPPAAELSADEARRLALRAQGFLGAPDRRGGVARRAAPSGRRAAGHDLGAGPLARADSRTPGSARSAARRSRPRTGRSGTRLRVLVARGLHPPHRGVAALRLPPPRLPRPPALVPRAAGRGLRHR